MVNIMELWYNELDIGIIEEKLLEKLMKENTGITYHYSNFYIEIISINKL